MKSIEIQDSLDQNFSGAIEVHLTTDGGEDRWCYFMTPMKLSQVGDFLEGTQVRVHYGAEHMIVVSELSEEVIQKTLTHIERSGALKQCTRVLG